MDEDSCAKCCIVEAVLSVNPLDEFLGVGESAFVLVYDLFGITSLFPLGEDVDGWLVFVGGRIHRNNSLFLSSKAESNIVPLLLSLKLLGGFGGAFPMKAS